MDIYFNGRRHEMQLYTSFVKQQTYSPNFYSILCFCDVQPYELTGANAFATKIEHFGLVYLVSLS